MANPFSIAVAPPLKGVARSTAFQLGQPEFSCYEAVNFTPYDVFDSRRVPGTRPPLSVIADYPGSSCNMLAELSVPEPLLLTAGGGTLYKYTQADGWSTVSSSFTIVSDRPVVAIPYLKKCVILTDGVPLIYDADTNTLVPFVAADGKGTVPPNPKFGCVFAGAIFLSGTDDAPHAVYASRVGDIFDWDFGADSQDAGRAWFSPADSGGQLSEPLTAMFANGNELYVAAKNQIWSMSGHPNDGSGFELASATNGILGPHAWCITPENKIFYLSPNGLMQLVPKSSLTGGASVSHVSRNVIPDELVGLPFDLNSPTVAVGYDHRWNAMHLIIRGESPQAWLFDPTLGGFWKQEYATYPDVLFYSDLFASAETSGLLFGGTGYGGLAQFNTEGTESLSSEIIIGPVQCSENPSLKSIIRKANFQFGAGTNDANALCQVYCGPRGQVAVLRAKTEDTSWCHSVTVGNLVQNYGNCYVHVGAHAAVIRLKQTNSAGRVVFEGATFECHPAGKTIDSGLLAPIITPPQISQRIQTETP